MSHVSKDELIARTKNFVRNHLENAEGGHDWWHIVRVHNNALAIANDLECNLLVVELAALLHDIADAKFHGGDESIGPRMARSYLNENEVDNETIEAVVYITENMSFKNSFTFSGTKSIEFQIVEDADRLDAIGAIGIARAFSYGGYKCRPFYDPGIQPQTKLTTETYKNSKAPTINHFHEKLLLLKNMMHTQKAKTLAENRHDFMLHYLEQFHAEWDGRK